MDRTNDQTLGIHMTRHILLLILIIVRRNKFTFVELTVISQTVTNQPPPLLMSVGLMAVGLMEVG